MESITERATYTRAELQDMKAKMERAQMKEEVDSSVRQIRQAILSNASGGKTSYFKKWDLPKIDDTRSYKVAMAIVDELRRHFPDVDIKYDSQTCMRTGKQINQGIYVEWS